MEYEVCLDGQMDVVERLKVAMGGFYRRYKRLPVEVAVAPDEVKNVRKAMAKIKLGKVPVVENGGALLGEVWLAVDLERE